MSRMTMRIMTTSSIAWSRMVLIRLPSSMMMVMSRMGMLIIPTTRMVMSRYSLLPYAGSLRPRSRRP